MNELKSSKMLTKQSFYDMMKKKEEENRNKINRDRSNTKANIKAN